VTRPAGGLIVLAAALGAGGCFSGDMEGWASRRQIIEAAERCGVPDFKPMKAGAAWAAYVDETVPDHQAKEDCIYNDLQSQGLLATR
jgi:hypothetical protein